MKKYLSSRGGVKETIAQWSWTRAASNKYFHFGFICWLFSQLIVYSIKCQKSVKNAHLSFPESNVMSFVQTTAQNTKTPYLFSQMKKTNKSSHLKG